MLFCCVDPENERRSIVSNCFGENPGFDSFEEMLRLMASAFEEVAAIKANRAQPSENLGTIKTMQHLKANRKIDNLVERRSLATPAIRGFMVT